MTLALSTPAAAKVYLISDNDDTLEISAIAADWTKFPPNAPWRGEAFAGMATLYQFLAANGVSIQYLSGNPNPKSLQFLANNKFPNPTAMTQRPPRTSGNSKGYPTTEQFKVTQGTQILLALIAQDSQAQFIFTGDNGEKDPLSFASLLADPRLEPFIAGMFVHELYQNGTPLGPRQIGYVSAPELALRLLSMKDSQGRALPLVTQEQIQQIAQSVSSADTIQIVPPFGFITLDEATTLQELGDASGNPETETAIDGVVKVERNACGGLVAQISAPESATP